MHHLQIWKDKVWRPKTHKRWRSVFFQRSTCTLCPSLCHKQCVVRRRLPVDRPPKHLCSSARLISSLNCVPQLTVSRCAPVPDDKGQHSARAKAIQTQRLLTCLKTNAHNSSNSSTVELGSYASGSTYASKISAHCSSVMPLDGGTATASAVVTKVMRPAVFRRPCLTSFSLRRW
jgi:hypothetical protein